MEIDYIPIYIAVWAVPIHIFKLIYLTYYNIYVQDSACKLGNFAGPFVATRMRLFTPFGSATFNCYTIKCSTKKANSL